MEERIKVNDMSCEHCQKRVKTILEDQPGVIEAQVYLDKGEAVIECEPGTDFAQLIEKLNDAGYPSEMISKPMNTVF